MNPTRSVIRSLALCAGTVLLCCREDELSVSARVATTGSLGLVPVAIEEVEVATLSLRSPEGLVPLIVRNTLSAVAADALAGKEYSATDDSELLRLNVPRPGQSTLQLFVSHQTTSSPGCHLRVLLLHNPETDETSSEPVIFSGRWLGEQGVHPRLADLDRDGTYELVYRDFQHNGTVTNTEQTVFLSVGEDLSLTEVLRIDVREMDLFSRKEWGAVRRRLMHATDSGGALLVLESWKENPRFGNAREVLASRQLQRNPLTGVWEQRQAPRVR